MSWLQPLNVSVSRVHMGLSSECTLDVPFHVKPMDGRYRTIDGRYTLSSFLLACPTPALCTTVGANSFLDYRYFIHRWTQPLDFRLSSIGMQVAASTEKRDSKKYSRQKPCSPMPWKKPWRSPGSNHVALKGKFEHKVCIVCNHNIKYCQKL